MRSGGNRIKHMCPVRKRFRISRDDTSFYRRLQSGGGTFAGNVKRDGFRYDIRLTRRNDLKSIPSDDSSLRRRP